MMDAKLLMLGFHNLDGFSLLPFVFPACDASTPLLCIVLVTGWCLTHTFCGVMYAVLWVSWATLFIGPACRLSSCLLFFPISALLFIWLYRFSHFRLPFSLRSSCAFAPPVPYVHFPPWLLVFVGGFAYWFLFLKTKCSYVGRFFNHSLTLLPGGI